MGLLHSIVPRMLGPYRLTRPIASREGSQRYEAYYSGAYGFEKKVVVECFTRNPLDPDWVLRFRDGARLLASLDHPNLLQVVDFGTYRDALFLVFESMDGMSASALIRRVAARQRRIGVGVALLIVREVLRGLQHVHELSDAFGNSCGMAHGDVSPENVWVGSAGQVKLGPFGLPNVRSFQMARAYPERAEGAPCDAPSDLLCAGILMGELLLTGPLFPAGPAGVAAARVKAEDLSRLQTLGSHLPDAVSGILKLALSQQPAERYPSARAFRAGIEVALAEAGGPRSRYELTDWLSSLGLIEIESGVRPVQTLAKLRRPNGRSLQEASLVPRGRRPTGAYRVRLPNGQVEGPITAAQLLRRVATGDLPDEAWLARDGQPFVPSAKLLEIQGLWARHPYRFRDPADPRAVRTPIELESLARHLLAVSVSRRSGLLRGDTEGKQLRIYFEGGEPVFASSTNPDTLLGEQLVAEGRVASSAIEAALARGWARDEPLGRKLVTRGLISAGELQQALERQMEARLIELASLRRGQLSFVPGARAAMPNVPLACSGPRLVARAILGAYREDEIQRVLAPFWSRTYRLASASEELMCRLQLDDWQRAQIRKLGATITPLTLLHDREDELRGFLTAETQSETSSSRQLARLLLLGLASGLLLPDPAPP